VSHRLLLLDDDAAIVAVLRRYFAARGFEVEACLDAAAALARVDAEPGFDAVICDLHFTPARLGEGLQIIERARARCPAAAVLLFTGAAEPALRATALRLGAHAVISKPAPLAQLHEAVRRAMKAP
jgi:ActR/RegA family two-component response regulator